MSCSGPISNNGQALHHEQANAVVQAMNAKGMLNKYSNYRRHLDSCKAMTAMAVPAWLM